MGYCELFVGVFMLLVWMVGYLVCVVGGFVGGMWNVDYLIVCNFDVYVWCEIFDGWEVWICVDFIVSVGWGGEESVLDVLVGGVVLCDEDGGWVVWMDWL